MKKPLSQKLNDRILKVMTWTCRAEDAETREEAQRCLRKVAKHSLKLARLHNEARERDGVNS